MKDFVPLGTGNSRFLKSVANFLTLYPDYASFAAALVAGTLPVDFNGINTAGIAQSGTPLNKSALLTDETAAALGLTSDDPTINEALAVLAPTLASARIEFGSYVGTGGVGSGSPCSITFAEKPKMVALTIVEVMNRTVESSYNEYTNAIFDAAFMGGYDDNLALTHIIVDKLSTSYQQYKGFACSTGTSSSAGSVATSYAKISEDGKTISWYNSKAVAQYNIAGDVYHYMAIF